MSRDKCGNGIAIHHSSPQFAGLTSPRLVASFAGERWLGPDLSYEPAGWEVADGRALGASAEQLQKEIQ